MINIKIDEDDLLDLLVSRVEYWNKDEEDAKLYEKMYEQDIECGLFDGAEVDIKRIVDNDVVNCCCIIGEGDEDYDVVKEIYERDGCVDVSCETCYSRIEAASDDGAAFLMRW